MKMNVYFVGASGVGKTTLAKHVVARYGHTLLTGATAAATRATGVDPVASVGDIASLDAFQRAVWAAQLAAEEPFWKDESRCFVSDRGPDLLAYTARMSRVAWEVARSEAFAAYMQRIRCSGRAIVFFVRPTSETLKMAQADGRREYFLQPEWQHSVDAVIEYLLESHETPYVCLASSRLKDRVRTIDAVLSLANRV